MKGAILFGAAAIAACGGSGGPVGGPVAGPVDTHCGTKVQTVSAASCAGSGAAGTSSYGPTQYNSEADDDDCKYHLKFSSTAVRENTDVTFTVVATEKATGGPATGANILVEAFLPQHPAPNTNQKATEGPPGTYAIGPVRFDAKGQWTVRFHLHQNCADELPDSPHGHAAFFLDVP